MDNDNKIVFTVSGNELLKMIKELKSLLWYIAVATTVVAVIWRLPEIFEALAKL